MVIVLKNTQPLLKLLKGELELCEKYLEVQKDMTSALVEGNIRRIDMIVKDEQYFVLKIESLESQRDRMMKQEDLGDLPLNEIIADHVEDDYIEPYKMAADALSRVLTELKKVTLLNQRLLRQRLSVFERISDRAVSDFERRA